jgi:hypothetical protein
MRFLLALWAIGCGGVDTAQSSPKVFYQTDEFKLYAQKFEAYSAIYSGKPVSIYNLIIRFGTDPNKKTRVGWCAIDYKKTPTIYIKKDYWDVADNTRKEALMFHELGHCVLGRRHNSNSYEGIPALPISLMYPNMEVASYYPYKKEEYLEELFSVRNDWRE